MEDREHRGNQINAHTNIDNENIKEESSIPNEDYTSSTTDVNEDQTESVPETIKSTVVKHDKKQGKSLVVPKITSVSKTNTKNIPLRTKKPIEQKSRVSGIVYTQAQKPKAVAAKPVVRKPRRKSEHWQLSEVGPEMQSSIGCEYKLSQIRLRQRIVYLMWRAVFDEAKRNTKRKVKL
ncbi:hypothetical protein DPMN_103415 [Dreissena polymorpha]|uniref:Uncharacterized protein n=1 Tax=Dreissena polymorpha TaxID=45954 RepID=A0A9D4H5X8_DREPO|nr:hypothetical protein DPMN_103415 [Dreissena polymorpha]